jgi:hypothetical protein
MSIHREPTYSCRFVRGTRIVHAENERSNILRTELIRHFSLSARAKGIKGRLTFWQRGFDPRFKLREPGASS